jgi:signal transduction histidine kinase
VSIYAQIYRYRHVATPLERQQTKWVVFGVVLTFVSLTLLQIPYTAAISLPAGTPHPWWQPLSGLGWYVALTILPLALAIAVMRYRLWDVDILINRTLVYGALTASVVGLYVLIVGGLSLGLQTRNTLPGVILALLVIAFLFQPLRQRLQRIADRFVSVPQSAWVLEQRQHKPATPEGQGAADTILRGRWLTIARVSWATLAILTLGLFLAAIPGYALEIRDYLQAGLNTVAPVLDILLYVSGSLASIASVLLCLVLALVLVQRKPNEGMALFVSSYLLLFGAVLGGSLERLAVAIEKPLAAWPAWAVQVSAGAKPLLFATPTIALLALFPSGRFVPRWTRWLTLCSVLLAAAIFYLPPWWWPNVENPIAGAIAILWAATLLAALYAQIYRYRRVSNPTERQQTKWVVFGFFLWLLLITLVSGPYAISYGSSPASSHPWWVPVVRAVWFLSSTILPITLTIAVMRYRLFDIDLLINRTVVYLSLTAIVVGIYLVMVSYLGVLFQTRNNLIISLIATGLVAVVFQPLRQRLQRGINRMMYGERDDPYIVLSRLGQRLEAAYAPESVLPTIVETVAQALKLPYVGIALNENREFKIAAEFGRSKTERISLPLNYQGEPVGQLVLAARAPGEQFTSSERQLLDDLARQAGVAAHAVHLTADLQRSRERLVLAREEERRRLRRDLHDDLAPTLASLGLMASTVADLIPTNPATAATLVQELQAEIRATVGNIRRLVYDLRPPTLDELGLLAAVRERAAQYSNAPDGFHVSVDSPAKLPALPAAVEVAAYRIVQEALENVSKHARARQCAVRFAHHNGLEIEISDDGIGLPPNIIPGVGLRSMRERAQELGGSYAIERGVSGGTRILARLPIGEIDGTLAHPDRG